jgi:hypothetical protein
MAETVRWVGVTRTEVKFHAKVIKLSGAILKKEMAVCGGWVMVRPPAAAVCGMLIVEWELIAGGAGAAITVNFCDVV